MTAPPRIPSPPPPSRPRQVVVVGATGTLGRAVARKLVQRGDGVVLVARTESSLFELERALSGEAAFPDAVSSLALDVRDPHAATKVATAAASATDLVVALGSFPKTPFGTVTREELASQLIEHCALFIELSRALAASIDRAGGAVIGFGDDGVERPYPHHVAYLAAKGALTAAMRALSLELSGRDGGLRVRFGLVAVGVVTDPGVGDPARQEALSKRARVGRTGTPNEVAHVALALMDATWASGEVWGVGR